MGWDCCLVCPDSEALFPQAWKERSPLWWSQRAEHLVKEDYSEILRSNGICLAGFLDLQGTSYPFFIVSPSFPLEWEYLCESLILWPSDVKCQLIGKAPDAGKDWGPEEEGTEDEMVSWHSPTQWTWIWTNSGRWWRTGKPGVLQILGLQRVGQDTETQQQQQLPTGGDALIGFRVNMFLFLLVNR